MKRRTPQPYKKELKKEMKKHRNAGERIIKQGVRNLIASIFKS